jgi:hypothetical protein
VAIKLQAINEKSVHATHHKYCRGNAAAELLFTVCTAWLMARNAPRQNSTQPTTIIRTFPTPLKCSHPLHLISLKVVATKLA